MAVNRHITGTAHQGRNFTAGKVPTTTLKFWSSRKNKSRSCKSKQASCAKSDAGLFARVMQQLGFWTQKIQDNVDYCYGCRREETRRM